MKNVDQKATEEKVDLLFPKIDLYNRIDRFVSFIILFPARLQNKRESYNRHRINREAINSISKILSREENKNNKNFNEIFNLALYIALLQEDLLYFIDALIDAKEIGERRFFAKHLATLLYESNDDLKELLGKPFRDSLNELTVPVEIFTQLDEIRSCLKLYRKRNENFLYEIRNVIASHRDHNTISYLEKSNSINPTELNKKTKEFLEYLNSLLRLLTQIILYINRPEILLPQMIKNR